MPKYYAYVHFGASIHEKALERDLLRALNGVNIIEVKKEDIDRWYDEECQKKPMIGSDDKFVLHGDDERDRFGFIMDTFFKGKDYEIKNEPDKDLKEWLKRRRENGAQ